MHEERLEFGTEALGVGRESAELRQLPHDDDQGEPVHVADLYLVGQKVGDEAESGQAHADFDERDDHRQHPGQCDRPVRVAADEQRHQAAKIIGEMEESGPSTRIREGPKTA